MRTRQGITQDKKAYNYLTLEVLLDIRELLGCKPVETPVRPVVTETPLPIVERIKTKGKVKRKYTKRNKI